MARIRQGMGSRVDVAGSVTTRYGLILYSQSDDVWAVNIDKFDALPPEMAHLIPPQLFHDRMQQLKRAINPIRPPMDKQALIAAGVLLGLSIVFFAQGYRFGGLGSSSIYVAVIMLVLAIVCFIKGITTLYRPHILNPEVREVIFPWNATDQHLGIHWEIDRAGYEFYLVTTTGPPRPLTVAVGVPVVAIAKPSFAFPSTMAFGRVYPMGAVPPQQVVYVPPQPPPSPSLAPGQGYVAYPSAPPSPNLSYQQASGYPTPMYTQPPPPPNNGYAAPTYSPPGYLPPSPSPQAPMQQTYQAYPQPGMPFQPPPVPYQTQQIIVESPRPVTQQQ
jgi:hypothetical protein